MDRAGQIEARGFSEGKDWVRDGKREKEDGKALSWGLVAIDNKVYLGGLQKRVL